MRFLVTGATSGLGRNAVEWLLKQGFEVHATGRNKFVGRELMDLGARFTELDLVDADEHDLRNLLKDCDIIWHCAALSSPWGKYKWFYQANVAVTAKLAYWAGKLAIKRFVHVSTPSIYFDFQSHIDIPETYLANKFVNDYAATKYLAEQNIQQNVINFPNTTYLILRPRGIFGPHDRVVFPRVLAQIKSRNGVLPLPNGGRACIDLTFVLNVVYALFLATTNNSLSSGEVFNISNQQPSYLYEMTEKLFKDNLKMDYNIRSIPYSFLYSIATVLELSSKFTGQEPLLTRYSVGTIYFDMTLNQQKAINRLGYRPMYTLNQGFEITANWLRNNLDDLNG